MRRAETQTRVIGTLLGHVNPDGSVEVKNAYAVPHNEQNGQVFVDVEFHRAMADLAKKVNPAEVVVGWYSTGNGVVPTDALIHEFYNHECKNPVHVTLDTQFTDGQKLMRAWVGRSVAIGAAAIEGAKAAAAAAVAAPEEAKDDTDAKEKQEGSRPNSEASKRGLPVAAASAATHFQEIGLVNNFDAAERIGVSLLSNQNTENLATHSQGLESTIRKLGEMLDSTALYVQNVVAGKTPGNAEVGRFLADALASVPRLTREQFEKVFGDAIQDVLLVMYLANVTKMQLMLAEKLQTASLLV